MGQPCEYSVEDGATRLSCRIEGDHPMVTFIFEAPDEVLRSIPLLPTKEGIYGASLVFSGYVAGSLRLDMGGAQWQPIARLFVLLRLKAAPRPFYLYHFPERNTWLLPFGRIELRDRRPWFIGLNGGELELPCGPESS